MPAPVKIRNLSRILRKDATDAERKLWMQLRRRQVGGRRFRRQHPLGPYIVDFVCLEVKLIVEIDGGQHADAVATDAQRTQWLEQRGFRVVRYWNNEVLGNTEAVLERIAELLEAHSKPPPYPSPASGGGDQGSSGGGDQSSSGSEVQRS